MRILRLMAWQLATSTATISCFVALVLWMKQSFRFISTISLQRLSFLDFFLFILWLLPELLSLALPFAFMLSILFFYKKYHDENMILTLRNAGCSDFALLKPVFWVGSLGMIFLFFMTLYLTPIAFQKFRTKELLLRSALSEQALNPGELKAIGDYVFYAQEKRPDGSLQGFFAYDESDKKKKSYIMARSASFKREGESLVLSLEDGLRETQEGEKLSFLEFDHYTFSFGEKNKLRAPKIYEMSFLDLMRNAQTTQEKRQFYPEAWGRLLLPLFFLSFGLGVGWILRTPHKKNWHFFHAVLLFVSLQFGSLILVRQESKLGFIAVFGAFSLVLAPLIYLLGQYWLSKRTVSLC